MTVIDKQAPEGVRWLTTGDVVRIEREVETS